MSKPMTLQSTENDTLAIYDIYVLSEGGIPVFAGCSTSDYCASHEGQHPLHAGFIHALQNFGAEVFSSGIQNLKFDTVKLNFKNVGGYTIVFVNPRGIDDKFIRDKLDQISDLFVTRYADRIQSHLLSENLYRQFMQEIVTIGLVAKDRLKSTRNIFVLEEQNPQVEEKMSLFSKFKRKFENLILR